MPKIPNWSRVDEGGHRYVRKAWRHDETGEVVVISTKVRNDGYYVMHFADGVDEMETVWPGDGRRIGYDPTQRYVDRMATHMLRENPDGFER